VPSDAKCAVETQTRVCEDGVFGQWSGTYTFEACSVAAATVFTCDQSQYGFCHAFSGANAPTDRDNVCLVGIKGASCPSGAVGVCDLSGVNGNPIGYVQHYYSAQYGGYSAKDLCQQGGGTWLAL